MTQQLRPSYTLRVSIIDDDTPVTAYFEAPETMTIDFVIARCTDPLGLEAASLLWRRASSKASPFWSPSKETDKYREPRLSTLCPGELFRADEYPSPFRGLVVEGGKRWEVVIANVEGAAPYDVELTFYARTTDGATDDVCG